MAKAAVKTPESRAGSIFTLTFTVEILGIDARQDCNEGWVELGPSLQGLKMQYQLYPGHNYDIDIVIWPHVAKIWYGTNAGFVRTWEFLDRRWLSFEIAHIFPVDVIELQAVVATIVPVVGIAALGSNAKSDKVSEVYLPSLEFGQHRYFAPVISEVQTLEAFMYDLIWKSVEAYIPASYLDGLFDVPHPVSDVRHQNAALYHAKESVLRHNSQGEEHDRNSEPKISRSKNFSNQKKKEGQKTKFQMELEGDKILANTGRKVRFEVVGERPSDLGEIIVIMSSQNLPASDDFPIFFINIDSLFDVPVEALNKYGVSHLYTQWSLGEEVHESEPRIMSGKTLQLDDHHAIALPRDKVYKDMASLIDDYFRIQLRGKRKTPESENPMLFGNHKSDRIFDSNFPPKDEDYVTDIIIATTKIDARALTKGISSVLEEEYPLLPPHITVASLDRETYCTNDQNGVKLPLDPKQIVPSYVILDAQMTLKARIGYAGCKPRIVDMIYSRMICLIKDSSLIIKVLQLVNDLNNNLDLANNNDEVLTGFAVDTGDLVIFYAEGPKDGNIFHLWEKLEEFSPDTIPYFSTAARYASRIYPVSSLSTPQVPFVVLKMYARLSVILALPPIYAKPALPLLAKHAVLKFGRLLTSKFRRLEPFTSELPSPAELASFCQELCVPPLPPNGLQCSLKGVNPPHNPRNVGGPHPSFVTEYKLAMLFYQPYLPAPREAAPLRSEGQRKYYREIRQIPKKRQQDRKRTSKNNLIAEVGECKKK